ncbi:hypothetical protein IscW_ISCW010218 [Ixodes scapularis]|uniref:Uncharacterized protein n=1 Tax=Ixodes scapularis TaxID=6945 RepID=B7Q0S0_IXOSC|nr:hypothetical protein IscW_ISCW010218 [Ixodes scapularis]|eukprot:XP_002408281.1 hypothetical protein IscW_ISCW010218 [Ixodes scapularis]
MRSEVEKPKKPRCSFQSSLCTDNATAALVAARPTKSSCRDFYTDASCWVRESVYGCLCVCEGISKTCKCFVSSLFRT